MKPHYALKRFGQNFLTDQNVLNKIVNIIDLKNQNIIEIGPGQGALTSHLVKVAKTVTAFEIDYNLSDFLKTNFANTKNLKIINQDFLTTDLSVYQNHLIVANIPYNITTQILFKIFANHQNFEHIILMVQKEFAARLCAKLKQSDYGKLAITTSLFYEAQAVFDVAPKAFKPQPKVNSTIVYLKRKVADFDLNQANQIMNFIKHCFMMKRKTLSNNLKQLGINQKVFETFCKQENLDLNIRPENLSLEQYLKLFNFINN